VHAWVQSAARQQSAGAGMEATPKAFCPYAGGEEVSWTGGASSGHTSRMGVPAHGAYAVRG
jgi:hypothetical protein